jgi:hypothetical protein
VQVFSSHQTIKLKGRTLLLLIEEKANRMHQNEAQQMITQMPQVTRPHPLHLTTVGQLAEDRIDEIADTSQDRTVVSGFSRYLDRQIFDVLYYFILIPAISFLQLT